MAASIRRFGFNQPILALEDGTIVAGHGRFAAAALIGLESVPVITLSDLNPEEARAYCLADNRLADLADWDEDLLIEELNNLGDTNPELVEAAGWSEAEVAYLLQDDVANEDKEEAEAERDGSLVKLSFVFSRDQAADIQAAIHKALKSGAGFSSENEDEAGNALAAIAARYLI